jgi:hypothetical protein
MTSLSASSTTTAGAGADGVDDVIRDDELRRLARTHAAATVPVLVEVAQPVGSREMEVPTGSRDTVSRPDAVTVVMPGHDHREPAREATRVVSDVLGYVPRYIPAAGAFACDATGAQLAQLARSRAVKSIRPNRRVNG